MKQGDTWNLIQQVIFKAWAEVSPDSARRVRLFHLWQRLEIHMGWKSDEPCSSSAWWLTCCMIQKSCFLEYLNFFTCKTRVLGYIVCKVIPVLDFYIWKSKRDFIKSERRLPEVETRGLSGCLMHSFGSRPAFAECLPSPEGPGRDTVDHW